MKKEQCGELKSNLEFINLFRHESRFEGEEQYYHTAVSTATEFLYNLSVKDLSNIDDEQYKALYAQAKERLENPQATITQ